MGSNCLKMAQNFACMIMLPDMQYALKKEFFAILWWFLKIFCSDIRKAERLVILDDQIWFFHAKKGYLKKTIRTICSNSSRNTTNDIRSEFGFLT